jgi:hypothetical protein
MSATTDVRTSLALSKGAITKADCTALLTDQGIPLSTDKGDNHVIVLAPARTCDHHTSRPVPLETTPSPAPDVPGIEFATSEHIISVGTSRYWIEDGQNVEAASYRLKLRPEIQLTYGQIISLAGDFYGDPDRPICLAGNRQQQIDQFQKNFDSLRSANPKEVREILMITEQYEFNPINVRVRANQEPSAVFLHTTYSLGGWFLDDENLRFDNATGGGGAGSTKFGRYVNLLGKNFDHFGEDAIAAYTAGHTLAQQTAKQAKDTGDKGKLHIAYAQDAFAAHFLTDLFSAGHIRTPRRAIYNTASYDITRTYAGVCALGMHDEDNKFGLWVHNGLNDRWVAYGDSRYRDSCNAANRRIMQAAIQKSMDEVWDAYRTGQIRQDNSEVLRYIPKPVDPNDRIYKNWMPLFKVDQTRGVLRRGDIKNPADTNYIVQGWQVGRWGLTTTAWDLHSRGTPYMPQREYHRTGFPPDEKAVGEIGWPMGPSGITGPLRQQKGITGPHFYGKTPVAWTIDGSPEPPPQV